MNPQQRQKILMIATASLVAIWAGDRFVVTPLARSYDQRVARIAELTKKVNNGSLLAARDATIRERWDGMRTNTLPTETSMAESRVLKAFETWSQEARVTITSIKPQWKRGADDYTSLECRVDASGSPASLARFLHAIEKDPMALKIELMELGARDNDGQQVALGLQVSALQLNAEDQQ